MFESKIEQPKIETPRLVLRPLTRMDADALTLIASDKRVAWNTIDLAHPLPDRTAENIIAAAQETERSEDVWAIDATKSGFGSVVGLMTLLRMDRQQSEIRGWVSPDHWNNGIASEAVEGIVDANPHGARTLFAAIFQDNPASGRVLKNAGFHYLGDAEATSVARGTTVQTWTYLRKLD